MKTHRSATTFDIASAIVVSSLAFIVLMLLGGWARAAELPRYNLELGRELTYRMSDGPRQSTDDEGIKTTSGSTTDWTITVVGRNADGSSRLVFREKNVFTQSSGGKETSPERWVNGFFDLQADGQLIERNALDSMSLPLEMFPRLPRDAASSKSSWSDELGFEETRRTYKAAAPGPGDDCSFDEDVENIFCLVDEKSLHRGYVFDLKRGLVRKVTTIIKWTAQPGRNESVSSTTIEFVSTRQLDSAEFKSFAEETSRYLATHVQCDELVDRADVELAHAAELFDQGLSALRQLQGQFELPAVQAMLEQKLAELDAQRRSTLEDIEHFVELIGKPSPTWKTTDLDGNPRSLEDYRGKVVLLDFWYRGCGWCMCAMPQIRQLAEDFRGQPVAVLGMNHNSNLNDARLVIDKLKLTYPSLRDGEDEDAISKKYDVRGWPTIVVIDSQGVIRHIHGGYGPNMRQQLGDKIRALLAEKPAAGGTK